MANRKISALTAILSGDISTANDYLPIVDASVVDADKNKRVTVAELGEAILAAGLTTDVSFTGNVTQTGTTAYAYKLARSGGGDKLRLRAEAAGGGGIINVVNSAEDDLEPLNLGGEYVSIDARVSAGATREIVRIDSTGLRFLNPTGDRYHYHGHSADGVFWQVSNNGDDFRWLNSTGDIAMILNATGTLVVGRAAASSNPLQLVANDATGDNYISFLRDNASTVKGFIGYGNSGDDTFFISNDESPGSMTFRVAGSGSFDFYSESGSSRQVRITHTASAVNYLQVTGGATGNSPRIIATGSDGDVGLDITSKGNATINFYTNNLSTLQVRINAETNVVNRLELGGFATGGGPYVQVNGSDTNIDLRFFTKGTGAHRFYTDHGATEQVRINHVANAVNRVDFYGNTTGNSPTVAASSGVDTNVGLRITAQGAANVDLMTDGTSALQVRVAHAANAVNYLYMTGSATGNVPSISAIGSDTNVDLLLQGQGTGTVRFGTHTGTADVAITGYITMKDSAGNTRKLAVIT